MGVTATLLAVIVVTFRVSFFCFPYLLQEGPDSIRKMGDNEFYHASFVTFLDSPGPSWEFGSQNLAGRLAYFYHFASYVGAAWFRSMNSTTSLTALFGLMTPLGTSCRTGNRYGPTASWFGSRLGFWAIASFIWIAGLGTSKLADSISTILIRVISHRLASHPSEWLRPRQWITLASFGDGRLTGRAYGISRDRIGSSTLNDFLESPAWSHRFPDARIKFTTEITSPCGAW